MTALSAPRDVVIDAGEGVGRDVQAVAFDMFPAGVADFGPAQVWGQIQRAAAVASGASMGVRAPVLLGTIKSGALPTPSDTIAGRPWSRASLTTRPQVSPTRDGINSASAAW